MKQKPQTVPTVKPRNWTVIALKSGMFRSKVEKNKKKDFKYQPI